MKTEHKITTQKFRQTILPATWFYVQTIVYSSYEHNFNYTRNKSNSVRPSVRLYAPLSFRHVPVFCPDEWRYDRAVWEWTATVLQQFSALTDSLKSGSLVFQYFFEKPKNLGFTKTPPLQSCCLPAIVINVSYYRSWLRPSD